MKNLVLAALYSPWYGPGKVFPANEMCFQHVGCFKDVQHTFLEISLVWSRSGSFLEHRWEDMIHCFVCANQPSTRKNNRLFQLKVASTTTKALI